MSKRPGTVLNILQYTKMVSLPSEHPTGLLSCVWWCAVVILAPRLRQEDHGFKTSLSSWQGSVLKNKEEEKEEQEEREVLTFANLCRSVWETWDLRNLKNGADYSPI